MSTSLNCLKFQIALSCVLTAEQYVQAEVVTVQFVSSVLKDLIIIAHFW